MIVRVKGIKTYRHPVSGIEYCYHRKTGTRIMAGSGTSAFFEEIARAEAKLTARPAEPKTGTLGALMKAYRASHHFQTLKPRTRSDYDKVLNYLADIDGMALVAIDRAFVAKLRDKIFAMKKRSFANYVLAVLSIVMEYGAERGDVASNPVKGVRKIRRRDDAPIMNRPWSAAEHDVVLDRAPMHLKVPLAIGRWTGMREGDVLRMPKTAYDGAFLKLRTEKRGVPVAIPVAAPLKEILDSAPKYESITLLANSRGRPWTPSGFRSSLFKFLKKLEAEGVVRDGLTFHGLRHTVATELRELGLDHRTIADMLGQKTEAMAAHYSREADLGRKLKGVVQRLERANAWRTKVSTNAG
jgi:integrase